MEEKGGKPPQSAGGEVKGGWRKMRLIDADALPIAAKDQQVSLIGAVADMVTLIANQPTVDAIPVRHGQWIGNKRHKACTSCGMTFCVPDGVDGELDMSFYKYCPKCGAKMKEGEFDDSE